MMITKEMRARCNGCHACFSVCPAKCISMTEDREGFLYPAVREDECLKCGKCLLVCPLNRAPEARACIGAYAAANKSGAVLQTSSSGGVFRALAETIIRRGGTVYGAAFAPDFRSVSHARARDLADLGRLQGSKYLQSAIGDAYRAAESDLQAGRWVLFSGTPCQIGGLRNYLGVEYPRLIAQDLVCHGVPSPMVWAKYLASRARPKRARVDSVSMRDKTFGWRSYSMRIGFSDGGHSLCRAAKDPFLMGFLQNLYLRPSCHECAFKSARRQGDLTLADLWGDDTGARPNDDRGVSLVGIHTEKGRALFAEAAEALTANQTDWAEALSYNPSALRSFPPNPNRERFFHALESEGFMEAVFPCLAMRRRDRLPAILKCLIIRAVRPLDP